MLTDKQSGLHMTTHVSSTFAITTHDTHYKLGFLAKPYKTGKKKINFLVISVFNLNIY
jgi:hypothetical protein